MLINTRIFHYAESAQIFILNISELGTRQVVIVGIWKLDSSRVKLGRVYF